MNNRNLGIILLTVGYFFLPFQVFALDLDTVSLSNPIALTNPIQIISSVIKTALSIVGALALLMVVVGARSWLWSAGNPEKIETGTKTMTWAVLGLILTLSSYILLSSILAYFQGPDTSLAPVSSGGNSGAGNVGSGGGSASCSPACSPNKYPWTTCASDGTCKPTCVVKYPADGVCATTCAAPMTFTSNMCSEKADNVKCCHGQ